MCDSKIAGRILQSSSSTIGLDAGGLPLGLSLFLDLVLGDLKSMTIFASDK